MFEPGAPWRDTAGRPIQAHGGGIKDHDDCAYLIFSSEWHRNITQDAYFMITSGCTGWAPNAAEYAVASSMLGTWEARGNPCTGPGAEETFGAQCTHILPVAGKPGSSIFMPISPTRALVRVSS